jgi:hypothetical protein
VTATSLWLTLTENLVSTVGFSRGKSTTTNFISNFFVCVFRCCLGWLFTQKRFALNAQNTSKRVRRVVQMVGFGVHSILCIIRFSEDKARAEVIFWSQNVYPESQMIEVVVETDEEGKQFVVVGVFRFNPHVQHTKENSKFHVYPCFRTASGCGARVLVFKQFPKFAILTHAHSNHQRVSFLYTFYFTSFQYDDSDYNSIGQLDFLTRLAVICDQLKDGTYLDLETEDMLM